MADQTLSTEEREQGARFAPKFDAAGLLTAVVTDAATGAVLVVAHMNREAVDATLTGACRGLVTAPIHKGALYNAGFKVVMLDLDKPTVIRRTVAFAQGSTTSVKGRTRQVAENLTVASHGGRIDVKAAVGQIQVAEIAGIP